jgi:altronate dehydratase large subunit
MSFMGYRRADGGAGVRNHVLVMSSVSCANGVVDEIAREVPDVRKVTHTEGCGRGPVDWEVTYRTLAGLGKNPNVYAVLVVGLGCESIPANAVAGEVAGSGKKAEHLVIQERGGSRKAAAAGMEIVKRWLVEASAEAREECPWEALTLGLECGGSDALSGVTANPAVGRVADWLVGEGGTVILSETTEMIGTERVLSRRAATPELGDRIVARIVEQRRKTEQFLGEMASMVISPGNVEGGLSNITEKSLGCIVKGGSTPIRELVGYGVRPAERGLTLMDTPGSDVFSLTGMAAGGAAVLIFTTGRGTPAGFPIAPVIKVASNSELYRKMKEDMDVDAGRVLHGDDGLDVVGAEMRELLKRVCEGAQTQAEINKQEMVAIYTQGPPF